MQPRKADQKDIEAISALLARCYPVLMRGAYAPETLAVALPVMIKANPDLISTGRFYVVDQGDLIVGCGGWSIETPGTDAIIKDIAHIRHFAVDPAFGRQGIGQSIYRQCERDALAAGMKKFQTFSSLNAESFYQSMGLRRLKQFDIPMGEAANFPVVHLEGPIR